MTSVVIFQRSGCEVKQPSEWLHLLEAARVCQGYRGFHAEAKYDKAHVCLEYDGSICLPAATCEP
eukprot:1158208-Pelagomonas_calceolata.AAC.42